ncbi:acyl-CoA thioesterase [Gilvimarinus agarilyticus]|uniref:Acyl-CoA thioester hydrolase n=1 Tax=Reichenbachiella agariperforans TaxID=156994 RepID=A0A1M6PXU0_REIAG|nr:thioesterase family protein [Reichenbachiella agariperforans]MBU2884841.1 acyl-CoA thioesterase [Gilvimarinus agarilyticus]MBU2913011.1 acyl-CoA thioesterase [Reichenbachiella agariperforans]SHK12711.1 acyl-CoA thioester hydrolase [Reichenbachiella agariperforans]
MEYIEASISVRARFSEVDAMGVVWHGNYLKYFEDGREHLGETSNMSYMDIAKRGYFVPIVTAHVDYKSPLTFGDRIQITCRLIKSRSAKLIHEYEVKNLENNKVSCLGRTEQVFLNADTKELELTYPSFYEEWIGKTAWSTEA